MREERLARALGWFSVGLGLAELVAAGRLSRTLGLGDRPGLVRAYGMREIANGAGLLAQRRRAPWLWARVGGDLLDMATLGAALRPSNKRRNQAAAATVTVAAITALDLYSARQLSKSNGATSGAEAAAVEIERSITIGKPAPELDRLWRDPATVSRSMGGFAEVAAAGEGRMRWTMPGRKGQNLSWETQLIEDRPGELQRWRSLPDAPVSNEGQVRFRPAPGDWGTEVTLRVRLAPTEGTSGGAAMKFLRTAPKLLAGQALHRFKSLAETGEIPTLERQPAGREDGRDD
jgi:uncharacterized membrane protein